MSYKDSIVVNDKMAGEKDTVGGFGPKESDVYGATIDYAFITRSKQGAYGLSLQFTLDGDSHKHREVIYFTSGTAKGGKNTYKDKQGNEQYLPGYLAVDSLAQCAVGKPFDKLADPEQKVIKLYNFDAKKEVATPVDMQIELVGTRVAIGLLHSIVDKNVESSPGVWVPSGETREQNNIDKFFTDGVRLTSTEKKAGVTEEAFVKTWLEKNQGKVKNDAKGAAAGGTAGAPKAGAAAGAKAAPAPANSLFED